jgi:hypothetical protein
MKVHFARAWPCFILLAALTACTQGNTNNKQDAGPTQTACTIKDDCATGQVCAGGVCIQGDCETRDQCPKPRDQVCNEFFRCVPDPNSPIRDQCPNGDRDCNLGQFCSAGTCYSTGDRTACTRSSQCSNADRCDARAGYCVPNLGGCDRCNDYPELCCSSDESCSPETGRCQTNSHGGIPCTVATEATDCLGGTSCHDGYCVQCWIEAGTTADGGALVRGCGPGTTCNTATGTCVSSGACESDADCSIYPGRRCAVATRQCTVPQCVNDSGCLNSERCNLETFQCYLPPAVCTETDEPNNAMSQATPLSMTSSGGYSGSSILCRGDQDYLSFPIQSGRRVSVLTTVTPALGAYGMTVALVGPNGAVLSESTLDSSGRRTLAVNATADGNAFLRIGSGSSTSNNQWNYTVDVTYSDPLLCDTEPGEPNETLASASQSVVVEGTFSRALCSPTDKDNHLFHAGANKRVTVSINYDSAVDFSLTLQTPTGSTLDSTSYSSPPVSLTTTTGATAMDMVLTVTYPSFSSPPADASIYTVTITQADPPMCGNGPPHTTSATALAVPPGTVTGVACTRDQRDWYRINLAQSSDITASLSFPAGMDFDLTLYESDGVTTIDSATSGSSVNPELVSGTGLTPGVYYLKVIPFTSTTSDYPAPYSLTITAPGYCVDDALDDGAGNDTASSAVGLRDFVDGPLNYSADLNLCGGDEDWFRVVALGHERLSVIVTGIPDALATVYASTASGLVELGRSRPTDLGGTTAQVFTSPIVATAGLFYVRVNAGPATDGAYHLVVRTEPDPCDGLGGDMEPNDAPANAQLASAGVNRGLFCPRDDVDVWKFTGSTGDVISATLSFDGTEGDADLALWQPGQAMAMAKDDAVNADVASTATVGATLTQGGLYWLVVSRKGTSLPVGQTYNLNAQGFTGGSSSSSSGGSSSAAAPSSSAAAASSSAMGVSSSAADSSSAVVDSSSAAAASSSGVDSSSAAVDSSSAVSGSSDPGVSSTDMSSSGGGSSAS